MKNQYQNFVNSYINFAKSHNLGLIMLYTIITILGIIYTAQNIQIETDLAALLPENTNSVLSLELSEDRLGSIDYFTIAIESKNNNVKAIAKIQDELKKQIEADWDDAVWVQTSRDTSFFRDHALYYLNQKLLKDLKWRLEDEVLAASSKNMPGLVNLLDDEDSDGGLEDWYTDDIPWSMGLPSQVCRSFSSFFNKDENEVQKNVLPASLSDRLISTDGTVGVVLVKLSKPSNDIQFSKEVLLKADKLIANINPNKYGQNLRVEVVGAYKKFTEIEAIGRDGQTATIISVILVLFLLGIFFRSLRTILIIFLPLLFAASLTMAIVSMTYGRLTLLTVFILALLVGMGIDYGIHLFGRTLSEIRYGKDLYLALQKSMYHTGIALLAAAVTTIASMLTLLFAHFEGFREFGIIASFGLFLSVISTLLIVPPLVFLFEKIKPIKVSEIRNAKHKKFFGGFNQASISRMATYSFFATLILVGAVSCFIGKASFERDIRNIIAPCKTEPIDYMKAIGEDSGTAPAIILADNRKQMKEVHKYLLKKLVKEKDPTILSFLTYFTFVPSIDDQLKRQEIIEDIGKILNKEALKNLAGKNGDLVRELRKMTKAKPFSHDDIPKWARRVFEESDGSVGNIGHIYVNVDDYDAFSGQEFQEKYGNLKFDGKWLPIASSRFILSDVVRMVQADGLRLLIIVSTILLLILFVYTRSFKATVMLFGVLSVGGLLTAGLLGVLDIKLSLFNIIVIPIILGVGIDGAIHLFHHFEPNHKNRILKLISTTGMTVSASSLTTMAGFTGLLFVEHKGLQSLGRLGSVGILALWLTVMLLMPFLLDKLYGNKKS